MRTAVDLWEEGKRQEAASLINENLSLDPELRLPAFPEQPVTLTKKQGSKLIARLAGDPPRLMFMPDTLLTALWLQFAIALVEAKTYKRCEWCHQPFEITPGQLRKSRAYCSNHCKQAAYRARKETERA